MIIMDHRAIEALIPHSGSMCLLDAVLAWDATSLHCLSRCHRLPGNPLRRADGTLGAACGIELAAQAMAIHGRLLSGDTGPPVRGALASVRDVHLRTATLDNIEGDLTIDAHRLMGDGQGATYRFVIVGDNAELLSGRATVLLGIGP
jgi:predicted hotdog family 3-hydroxylacyl-ACP dehydratase